MKKVTAGALAAALAIALALLGFWTLAGNESAQAQGNVDFDIDPEITGNGVNTLGMVEDCVRVNVPSPAFDGVSDYNIDIVVTGDTEAPMGYDASLNYDPTKVDIAPPGTDPLIKLTGAGAMDLSDPLPDSDGTYAASALYLAGGPGTAGNGTIVRVGLDIGASGVVTFSLNAAPETAYKSGAGSHPITLGTGTLAINQDCQVAATVSIKVTGLTAAASSITLAAGLDTGDITLSLQAGTHLAGSLDESTGTGTLYWPVVADFPLLHDLGRDPLELVLVGSFFTHPARSFLIAYDIGFIDDPLVGPVYFSNNNKDQKNVVVLCSAACGEEPSVDGTFVDIDKPTFDALERDRLRSMMDDAMVSLRAFDPSVPGLPPEVLDTFFSMYDSDPSTELIMYFAATDTYQTSQLTGTDQLTKTCGPAVGGTTELSVDSSGSPARASEGGGAASFPFPAIAGTAAAAAAAALAAGGWYTRRRFSKG